MATRSRASFPADLQDGEERLLRNLDRADLLHALLALLLFLEQLALARDVAAVALGQHVLAQRLDGRPRDDVRADRRLHRHLEHLPGDQLLHLVDQLAAPVIGVVAVHDDRQRIDRVAVDQDVELRQRRALEVAELVVERRVATAGTLQAVEEVEHHFGERQLVLQRHLRPEVEHLLLHAAFLAAQLQHRAHVLGRHEDVGGDDRLAQLLDQVRCRQLRRIVDDTASRRRCAAPRRPPSARW